MQKRFLKTICRILSLICAGIILFLSPCARYIDASSISEVHAVAETIGGGAIAGGAIAKFLGVTFGAIGAKEVYDRYEDEINEAFYDYISAPSKASDEIMKVARVNAENGQYQFIPLDGHNIVTMNNDEIMEWVASGGAASAAASLVDSLTDLYVQFAPWLLESFDDFMNDVLSGDIYIDGFSEAFDMVDTFTDYESIRNADGTYHFSGYVNSTTLSGGNTVPTLSIYSSDVVGEPFIVASNSNVYNFYTHLLSGKYNTLYVSRVHYVDSKFFSSTSISSATILNTSGHGFSVPIFSSLESALAAFEAGTFSTALNFTDKTMESVIDLTHVPDLAPDIPPFTRPWQRTQWGEVSDVIDFGGIAAGEYEGDDLPFWGLAELDEFAQTLQDIFDKALEGIFEGTDVIEFPTTYDDVWDDVFTDAWDRVKDGALDIPVDDTGEAELDKVRPYPWEGNPAIPDDPAIPDNPAIDIPIDDVIDIPIEDIVPTVNDSFFDVAGSLRYKFPFSIPWDIHYMLSCLAETPKAPRFELPIVLERYGINEKIIIDMEMFQTLSELARSFFSMLFAIFLVNLTFKVVGMRKEE